MATVGRMTLLVNDIDATKAFYADAFGFGTLFDEKLPDGFRAVHIGPGTGAGLWLIAASSPDAQARVGTQTGDEPALVLYTEAIRADLQRLEHLGVHPLLGPQVDPAGAIAAHVRDNSGNEIVLVQLPTGNT